MYETSIRIMLRYIATKYDNVDKNKNILNKLKQPKLEKPKALDSGADKVDNAIYKEDTSPKPRTIVRSPGVPINYTHWSWDSAHKSYAQR